MAGSMKEIKLRIRSVESTMQITKAMELVETAAPESKCLVSMQFILNKFEAFSFDPMKPQELKPYRELFDEFSVLMSKGPEEK